VRRAVVSAAVALGSVLLAAGCGSGDVPSGAASTPDPGDASTPVSIARLIEAADLPPCPEAGAAPPREGGLPELTLGCLGEGSPVTLSGLRGTPLVVNVWASWCPPCAEEMPYLNTVAEAAAGRVRFLGIDLLDQRARGLAWAKDFAMTFPSVEDPDGVIRARLRVPAPPVTLFVRPDGQLAKIHYGPFRSDREVREAIAAHLGVRL